MDMNTRTRKLMLGFTLVEILAALTIGSMILIVVLAMYSRAQSSAASVTGKLENNRLPREIMQRIAEDLGRVSSADPDTQITVENKYQDGFAVAKMEISRTINDIKNQPQLFEKIVWQSSIEPDTGVLTLYRSHSGLAMEDVLLDRQKEPWQRELFVPVCTGLSFFRIEVPRDVNTMLNEWSAEKLPPAIVVTLSFAPPFQAADGTFDVPDEDKIVRTIAIDRTRKPRFTLPPIDPNLLEALEPNETEELNDINDVKF
jgi:type II secretory pathway pseudopilin PulG